ncbi:hypothetical protein COY26_00030 [Candidatus Woesearchaeota archaeon CG_4_10_14_0_2_um_filter_33_10]|nr:MAG: hypothetical protein COY26_00030 [Candidatus Woesearchaeota archaeon CG_4_10_14_0_2_um_filter_33_10]
MTWISNSGLKISNIASNDNWNQQIYGDYYFGQYWTAGDSYIIDSIQCLLRRNVNGNNVTIHVFAADGNGYPTGGELGSKFVETTGITTDSAGEWVTFDLSASSISITSSTKYVWYLSGTGGDGADNTILLSQISNVLANSYYIYHGGSTWYKIETYDSTFKIYSTASYYDHIEIGVNSSGIKLDDLGAPDDNTDLNANTTAHGLLPKLDNNAANYLDGTGSWSTPSASESDTLATVTGRGNTTTQNITIGDKLTFAFDEFIDNLVDGWLRVNANLNVSGNVTPGISTEYSLGSYKIDNVADLTFNGSENGDYLGMTTRRAGDFNGDGYTDLVVGSYMSNLTGSYRGKVLIFFGNSSMEETADIEINGTSDNGYFGYKVDSAGDVNGDGYDDIIIGSPNINISGSENTGQAHLFFGGSNVQSSMNADQADIIINGSAANDYFGDGISSAGDINGDGYSDVMVGAPYASSNGKSYNGQAYIYLGGTDIKSRMNSSDADIIINGSDNWDMFGIETASAGDVNGDGYSDVVVGALYSKVNGIFTGRAFIFYGSNNLLSSINSASADVRINGSGFYAMFGWALASAGDVNGDGYSDVIVGSYNNSDNGLGTGQAYIYFGGANITGDMDLSHADVTLNGTENESFFGGVLSCARDVNGDGYSDVIVGADEADAGGTDRGQAFVFFGGPDMLSSINVTNADLTINGSSDEDGMGAGVTYGDFNKDGYSDVVVGAYGVDAGGTDRGQVYIYYGTGKRWKNIFAQEANLKTGIHIGELEFNRYGITTPTMFGIKAPNWEIDRVGTASFQDVLIGSNLNVLGNITGGSPVKIKGGLNVLNESGDSQLYVNDTTGNVGIGTTNPTQKLDVNGDIGVSSGSGYYINDSLVLDYDTLSVVNNNLDTTDAFVGGLFEYTKTMGVTDGDDMLISLNPSMVFNQSDGVVASLYSTFSYSELANGTSTYFYSSRDISRMSGGATLDDFYGTRTNLDLDAGTVGDDAIAIYGYVDQEADNTISGDLYGLKSSIDADGTVTGTSYLGYFGAFSNVDYGIYQTGDTLNYFQGNVGIGTTTPSQKLEVAGSINVTSSGNISLGTNQKIYLGDGQEIALYYNGTHFVIDGT